MLFVQLAHALSLNDVCDWLRLKAPANGAELDIKVKGDTIMVNDAKIVKADVAASNGVIHVVDKVLMPPTK